MKKYIVRTRTVNNPDMTFELEAADFETDSLDAACKAYEEKVNGLGKCYYPIASLGYTPKEKEMDDAIFSEIVEIDEKDPERMKQIRISDYFFDK